MDFPTILIGETLTIYARDVTADLLHAKQDWARLHNNPDVANPTLEIGAKAKIVNAFARNPRGEAPLIEVEFDETEVRVKGLNRGLAQVDIIDEISQPAGVQGLYGGIDILVQDSIDRAAMKAGGSPIYSVSSMGGSFVSAGNTDEVAAQTPASVENVQEVQTDVPAGPHDDGA